MKAYIILFFIYGITLTTVHTQPKLVIPKGDTVQWGNVKPVDSPLEAKITLKNEGTEPLRIYYVRPSCGCTVSKLDKNKIPPDSSATISISVNIDGMPEDVHKTITLQCSDPDNRLRTINLLAHIIYPIRFDPSQILTFGNMAVGLEAKAKIKIFNTTDKDITIKEVKIIPEIIKTNLKDDLVLKPHSEFEIVATVTPQSTGIFSGNIKFKTTYPDIPYVQLQARGMVLSSLKVLGK